MKQHMLAVPPKVPLGFVSLLFFCPPFDFVVSGSSTFVELLSLERVCSFYVIRFLLPMITLSAACFHLKAGSMRLSGDSFQASEVSLDVRKNHCFPLLTTVVSTGRFVSLITRTRGHLVSHPSPLKELTEILM